MKTTTIKAGSALSTQPESPIAAGRAARDAVASLEGAACDIAFVFFSPHHHDRIREVVAAVLGEVLPGQVLGCSTQAVVGAGQEIEHGPAVAVWAASLPGVEMTTFTLTVEETADGPALVGFPLLEADTAAVLLMADPFTFPAHHFLSGVNADHPGVPVIGGMASGEMAPGGNLLVSHDSVRNFGAVGAALRGVDVTGLVSQGARPVGEPYAITAGEQNVILELGGEAPLGRLDEVVRSLPGEDHALLQGGLLLGLVIDETAEQPVPGDFLIRNFRASMETGAIEVGEAVHPGQIVQFQLRDAATADAELKAMLSTVSSDPQAALMFTCNGRGVGMFGAPNHDARVLEETFGDLPAAGMFCQGELGPVGGVNFLHGFTASLALFAGGASGSND